MTAYVREDALVAQFEGNIGARIEASGEYTGRFTLARERIAGTGTQGMEFVFEANDGKTARNLRLWLNKADGTRIERSHALLSALMVCLGLERVETTVASVEEWDADLQRRVPNEVPVFADLMNKPIGIVLQREEREWEGRPQVSMVLVGSFDPRDRSMAAEILDGSRQGRALDIFLRSLRERVVRAPTPAVDEFSSPIAAPAARPAPVIPTPVAAPFDDEDIPF